MRTNNHSSCHNLFVSQSSTVTVPYSTDSTVPLTVTKEVNSPAIRDFSINFHRHSVTRFSQITRDTFPPTFAFLLNLTLMMIT